MSHVSLCRRMDPEELERKRQAMMADARYSHSLFSAHLHRHIL